MSSSTSNLGVMVTRLDALRKHPDPGIYVAASLVWLRAVEGVRPDRWDVTGASICVIGALVVLFGKR